MQHLHHDSEGAIAGTNELGGHDGEDVGSDDTDSIIDLQIDEIPSDDDEEGWDESRLRKFSFDGEP